MNIGELQRKLSQWAEQDKHHKFYDLFHLLYDKDWLQLAHDYVKQNAGSVTAGCDGITMTVFDENLEAQLQQLAQELKSQTFAPRPVRRVHIPKANGRLRKLGIPAIRDRIVQEALRMILEPLYEADFSQYSFGFRPNRCTMDAVKCILWSTQEHKKFFWVVEGDISAYFDTINHRRLMKILRRRIKDEKLLRLIWKFLRAGVMERKLFHDTKRGTPQGGIISPLLANIYLHELDRYMQKYAGLPKAERARRRQQRLSNFVYVRYADDFIVLCNGTKQQAEALKQELHGFLNQRLRLKLCKEKTRITHLNEGFKFLGFWMQRCLGHQGMTTKVLIPKAAVKKVEAKIKAATDATTRRDSVNSKFLALNRIINGWCRYYQYTSKANTTFRKISRKVFKRVAHWLGRKSQMKMTEVMKRYHQGDSFATEKYRLKLPHEFETLAYKKRFLKPNPYTKQESIGREELSEQSGWTGYNERPGMADLRPVILERDKYICQMCDKPLKAEVAEVDHIKPIRRYKRPIDANRPENLWTLCIDCHRAKTKSERQMESRMR